MVDAGPSLRLYLISDRAAVMTRQFRAPRELVSRAMSEPEQIERWWGPHGQQVISVELDRQVGGRWRVCTVSRDGREHAFTGIYLQLDTPGRTVQTFTYDVGIFSEARSIETLILEEHGDVTTMTLIARYSSPELMDVMLEWGLEQGASESYDRLQAHLDTLT